MDSKIIQIQQGDYIIDLGLVIKVDWYLDHTYPEYSYGDVYLSSNPHDPDFDKDPESPYTMEGDDYQTLVEYLGEEPTHSYTQFVL